MVKTGDLDRLIRDNRMTPELATSLINDCGSTMNTSLRLIDAVLVALGVRTQAHLASH